MKTTLLKNKRISTDKDLSEEDKYFCKETKDIMKQNYVFKTNSNGINCSEIDFLEFSKFVDSLWSITQNRISILKLNPPTKFIKNIANSYIKRITELLKSDLSNFIKYQNTSSFNNKTKHGYRNMDTNHINQSSDNILEKIKTYDDIISYNKDKLSILENEYLLIREEKEKEKLKFDTYEDNLILKDDSKLKEINRSEFINFLEERFWEIYSKNNHKTKTEEDESIKDEVKSLNLETNTNNYGIKSSDKEFSNNIFIHNVDLSKIFSKNEINTFIFPFLIPNFFSLLNICFLPDSLLQYIYKESEDIIKPGLNIPYFYMGSVFSQDKWSIENCYRVYYLHEGAEILWYSINLTDSKKIKTDLNSEIDLNSLRKNGINIIKTIQKCGQMMICLPGCFYKYVCLGFNKFESINFIVSHYYL